MTIKYACGNEAVGGDLVVRIGYDWCDCIVGHPYTVEGAHKGKLKLVGDEFLYDEEQFRLIRRKEQPSDAEPVKANPTKLKRKDEVNVTLTNEELVLLFTLVGNTTGQLFWPLFEKLRICAKIDSTTLTTADFCTALQVNDSKLEEYLSRVFQEEEDLEKQKELQELEEQRKILDEEINNLRGKM